MAWKYGSILPGFTCATNLEFRLASADGRQRKASGQRARTHVCGVVRANLLVHPQVVVGQVDVGLGHLARASLISMHDRGALPARPARQCRRRLPGRRCRADALCIALRLTRCCCCCCWWCWCCWCCCCCCCCCCYWVLLGGGSEERGQHLDEPAEGQLGQLQGRKGCHRARSCVGRRPVSATAPTGSPDGTLAAGRSMGNGRAGAGGVPDKVFAVADRTRV